MILNGQVYAGAHCCDCGGWFRWAQHPWARRMIRCASCTASLWHRLTRYDAPAGTIH